MPGKSWPQKEDLKEIAIFSLEGSNSFSEYLFKHNLEIPGCHLMNYSSLQNETSGHYSFEFICIMTTLSINDWEELAGEYFYFKLP